MNTYSVELAFNMQGSKVYEVNAQNEQEAVEIAGKSLISDFDNEYIHDAYYEVENCEIIGE